MDRGHDSHTEAGGAFAVLTRLFADGRALVQAEIAVQRAALAYRAEVARPALIGLLVAIVLVQAAVVCLLVMIAIWLSSLIPPVLAGLAVTLSALVVAGIISWAAIGRLRQLSDLHAGEKP